MDLKNNLKTLTYPMHEWLETSPIFNKIKENELSYEEYLLILTKMYQFIAIIEPKIKEFKEEFKDAGLNDIEERLKKTQWLLEDIKALNIEVENIELETKSLDNFDSLAGALYVLEGSTMGGMQIVKMMKKNFEEELSYVYYSSYGKETMPMWMSFASWLNDAKIDQYKAVLGASEVFILLKKHLDN